MDKKSRSLHMTSGTPGKAKVSSHRRKTHNLMAPARMCILDAIFAYRSRVSESDTRLG